jgi:hypothetical protein
VKFSGRAMNSADSRGLTRPLRRMAIGNGEPESMYIYEAPTINCGRRQRSHQDSREDFT